MEEDDSGTELSDDDDSSYDSEESVGERNKRILEK